MIFWQHKLQLLHFCIWWCKLKVKTAPHSQIQKPEQTKQKFWQCINFLILLYLKLVSFQVNASKMYCDSNLVCLLKKVRSQVDNSGNPELDSPAQHVHKTDKICDLRVPLPASYAGQAHLCF